MDSNRRMLFDDMFDIFSMLVGSNYVTLYDVKERITRFSPAIVDMVDIPGEYVTDGVYNWTDHIHPDDKEKYENTMGEMFALRQRTYDLSYRVRLRSGEYNNFRFIGGMIRDEDGHPSITGGMMINSGLTEHTDRATAMRNIQGFFEDIIKLDTTAGESVSILMLGFGRLTHINEVYGYGYGSRLLKKVGDIITERAGDSCGVYRMEGSKFALIADSISTLSQIYEDIRKIFIDGIELDGVVHNLIAYGGMMTLDDGSARDEHALHDCLLHAYSESKHYRHGDLVIYNGDHTDDPELSGSIAMIAAIRESIKSDFEGFYLMYQPIFGRNSDKPTGAEAYLRWKHDDFGDVPFHAFISEIEQDNDFNKLGNWMLKRAMLDGLEFLEVCPDFMVHVSVVPAQINDPYFVNNIKEIAADAGFPLAHLRVGLTRSCRLLGLERTSRFVKAMKSENITIGLDSFARENMWLKTFSTVEPDFVRFSAELTENLKNGEKDRTILSYLIKMINACDTDTFVKGINTKEEETFIAGLPVTGMQGSFLAEPMYYDEVIELYGGSVTE